MTNNVMLDSSILVEYIKNTRTKLLVRLLSSENTACYITETVASEFLYYFLAVNGGKSPRTLQDLKNIKNIFENSNSYQLINSFSFLPATDAVLSLAPYLMRHYNMLPNDAIILATCKIHNIRQLASHDSDFIDACKGEGITLLTEN